MFSSTGLQSAVSTAQAVINWRQPESALAGRNGNWWQVLGPRGTSDAFLHGHPVPAGAVVRLRHVASGGLLRAAKTQPALARPDLKEVSCLRNDTASTADEEWTLRVNGTAVDRCGRPCRAMRCDARRATRLYVFPRAARLRPPSVSRQRTAAIRVRAA